MDKNKIKKKNGWSWKIDEDDLKDQVDNYDNLKISKSYRGLSVLIFSVLLGFSLLLSFLGIYSDPTTMFLGILFYLPILFFVYRGHRWAIILLMIMWTIEKGSQLYEIGQSGNGSVIVPIIWWLIFMPYFWKAFEVEKERKNKSKANQVLQTDIRFCNYCGTALEKDSKFCQSCGKNISHTY